MNVSQVLQKFSLESPLGQMIAIADEKSLFLLEFVDRRNLQGQIRKVSQGRIVKDGCSDPIRSIQEELSLYFQAKSYEFQTPFVSLGTPFQKAVWKELKNIAYGQTISYGTIGRVIGNPKGCRAVAQAVGANPLAILIPCHRVIRDNGDLGGYAGGIERKQRLLALENSGVI